MDVRRGASWRGSGLLVALLVAGLDATAEAQDDREPEREPTESLPLRMSLQESQEERLRRAEDLLQKQQERIDVLERARGKKGFSLNASFTDGFHIMDNDGNFDMHLGGRVIVHFRNVFNLPHAFASITGPPAFPARTQPNTFYINSAYLIMEGTIFKEWGYRVTGEVSTGTGGPTARLETTYVEWKRFKEFSIRAGNFKDPLSPDTIASPLFLDEIERSILAQFVPAFELGVMIHGSLWDTLLTYQAAVTNGRSYLAGVGRARNDDDSTKEEIARITAAPFVLEEGHLLRNLRLGLSGSIGSADTMPLQTNLSIASTELAVTWLVPGPLTATPGVFLNGQRIRAAGELSWFFGPVSFRMEGLYRTDRVTRPSAVIDEHLLSKAWYAQAGVILTGEEKTLDARIRPAHPFDIGNGNWGALELVARFSQAVVNRGTLLDLGTDLAASTNRMGSITVGLNWWPVQNIRISLDGVREQYYSGVQFLATDRQTHLYGLLARFQVDF